MRKLEVATQSGDWYDETRPEDSMRFISECGFEGIDYNINNMFSDTFDGKTLTSFFDKSDEELYEYYKPMKVAAEKYHISISQAHAIMTTYSSSKPEWNAYYIKVLEKQFAVCHYLGCESIVVHPYHNGNDILSRDEERAINLEVYRNLIPAAKKYKMKICLENLFKAKHQHISETICSSAEELSWFVDTLNEEAGDRIFGVCLDIGHANVLGKDLYHYIKTLGERLTVLHIHDNNGLEDEHMFPYTQQRGYHSTIDWERFLLALKEIDYEGPLAFETFRGVNALPQEVQKEGLRLVSAIGRYFRKKLEEH